MSRSYRNATLKLWFSFFLCFAALYFLMSWVPKLMEDSGYEAAVGREAFFLFNLGGVTGIYAVGALATRWHLTTIVCGVMVSAAAGMFWFATVPEQQNLLLGLIFLIGALQQGGLTGLYAAAAKSYPTSVRTTGVGWAIGLGRSGAVAGPALAGYFIAAGLDMSANFMIFAVPMILSGVVAFRLKIP